MGIGFFQRLLLSHLQQSHELSGGGSDMFHHRAGAGACSALVAFAEILPADFPHFPLKLAVNGFQGYF